VLAIATGLPIVPVCCVGTRRLMPRGSQLTVVPGKVEVFIEPPIQTTDLTYEDRDACRNGCARRSSRTTRGTDGADARGASRGAGQGSSSRTWSVRRPGDGEVVVKIGACGICGSDLHWYHDQMMMPVACPGHEIAGTIAMAGRGADGVREGDRVTLEGIASCGTCRYCLAGNYHYCPRIGIIGMTIPAATRNT
jgi:hypothetical protein